MTRNEQIAEKLGWYRGKRGVDRNYYFSGKGKNIICQCSFDFFNPEIEIEQSKLLQAKMVADGWGIEMRCYKFEDGLRYNRFCAIDDGDWNDPAFTGYADTEPAALHALFCKVYDIGVRNEK